MIIESMRVQNYKVLRDVHLTGMPRMAVFLGANGSGKSTLLDVFAFLQDSVRHDVEVAVNRRGGIEEVLSRDSQRRIVLSIAFRLDAESHPLIYNLYLEPFEEFMFIEHESLWETVPARNEPLELFSFDLGVGRVLVDMPDSKGKRGEEYETHSFKNLDTLAVDTLGQFKNYSTASKFRQAIDEWHCTTEPSRRSRFRPARSSPQSLAPSGTNLVDFAQYLHEEHRPRFEEVIRKMRKRVPNLKDVEPYKTEDGRVILRFADGSFEDPFPLDSVSEGTRKLFAILLMLHEPNPHSLLTYEEPENDLYPKIVRPLAEEFREYAERGSQVLVSTHSPDFVNGLELEELYWMEKRDGYSQVVRAKDDENLVAQHAGGDLLGALWREGFFGRVDPK